MSKQYKIGFLLGSLSGAGAENTILTLSRFLKKEGAIVTLHVLEKKGDYELSHDDNVCFVKGASRKEKKLDLLAYASEEKYDLFVTSRAEYYSCDLAKKVYCSVHITPTAWLNKNKYSKLSLWIKKIKLSRKFKNKKLIALSQGIKNDLIDNLGCDERDIKVINNPYDVKYIGEAAQETNNLPDYEYIIYVAALIPRKRQMDLLKAYKVIGISNLKLLLVGKGPDEEALRKEVKLKNLEDSVVFWGWDSNPIRLIKNAKLSILASEAEGLPRVLVESLLVGTPIVSTNCPSGPNEVLLGEFCSYLVPVGDVDRLAESMRRALSYYPDINNLNLHRYSASVVAKKYIGLVK